MYKSNNANSILLDINKQIFIMATIIAMAVMGALPAVEMHYAYANVNKLDSCGPTWGGWGSGSCHGDGPTWGGWGS